MIDLLPTFASAFLHEYLSPNSGWAVGKLFLTSLAWLLSAVISTMVLVSFTKEGHAFSEQMGYTNIGGGLAIAMLAALAFANADSATTGVFVYGLVALVALAYTRFSIAIILFASGMGAWLASHVADHADGHLGIKLTGTIAMYAFLSTAVFAMVMLIKASFKEDKKPEGKEKTTSNPMLPAQKQEAEYASLAKVSKFNFSSMSGMEDTKAKLLKVAQEVMGGFGVGGARNGILLSGEPGNGKTMFAEALAGELDLPFVKLTFDAVASKWINQTTEGVKAAFHEAFNLAPSILFIDEIDSFLINRDSITRGDSEEARTTNAMLTLINELRSHRVILVAATNHMDKLDSAGVREGRFDFKMVIPPPDMKARLAILNKSLKRTSIAPSRFVVLGMKQQVQAVPPGADADDIERAAKRWEGFSAARIAAIATEASISAKEGNKTSISFDDLMDALRRLQGSSGDALPEDTPGLVGVYLPTASAGKMRSIANRMKEIEKIEEMGGSVPTGLLFYGPPGTGKTLAARALAKETGWAFLSTNGQSLTSEKDVIQNLLKRAANLRPVIIFIDEADDILGDRATNFLGTKSVTNELLTAMDGAKGKTQDIVWIAATNLPDALDAATLRGGRFTEKILFDLPDGATVARYVEDWMKTSKATFAITPEIAALHIGQASIANVKAMLQAAVNNWIGTGVPGVDVEHIVAARQEVIMEVT